MQQSMAISRDVEELLFFAYKNDTKYAKQILESVKYFDDYMDELHRDSMSKLIAREGFFAKNISSG